MARKALKHDMGLVSFLNLEGSLDRSEYKAV